MVLSLGAPPVSSLFTSGGQPVISLADRGGPATSQSVSYLTTTSTATHHPLSSVQPTSNSSSNSLFSLSNNLQFINSPTSRLTVTSPQPLANLQLSTGSSSQLGGSSSNSINQLGNSSTLYNLQLTPGQQLSTIQFPPGTVITLDTGQVLDWSQVSSNLFLTLLRIRIHNDADSDPGPSHAPFGSRSKCIK